MRNALLPALACLLLGGCDPAVQPTRSQARFTTLPESGLVTLRRDVTGGNTLTLSTIHVLNDACVPLGDVAITVTAPPDHGTVHVDKIMIFTNYRKTDPHYLCNAKKTPAVRVTYRPADGYTGDDVVVIQTVFPGGKHPQFRYNISVDGSF